VLTLAFWGPAEKVLGRILYSGTAINSIQPTIFKVMIVIGAFYIWPNFLRKFLRSAHEQQEDISVGN
jgi:hypothetical protein